MTLRSSFYSFINRHCHDRKTMVIEFFVEIECGFLIQINGDI